MRQNIIVAEEWANRGGNEAWHGWCLLAVVRRVVACSLFFRRVRLFFFPEAPFGRKSNLGISIIISLLVRPQAYGPVP